jgi:hypothetical protein
MSLESNSRPVITITRASVVLGHRSVSVVHCTNSALLYASLPCVLLTRKCVACRTSNGTYDTLAAEINDALTDCIGVNGTNAVGSGSTVSSTTTSSALETSIVTSLTTIVSSYTTTNAEGLTQTVLSSVTSATVAHVV